MNAYKSLKAYFFFSGFVKEIGTKKLKDYILLMGKVSHSQRLNKPPLQPWALLCYSCKIDMVYYTCMAGKGEACSCAAVILFYIEHYNRNKIAPACTDVKSKWIIPSKKTAEYKKIKDIDFGKASLFPREQKSSPKENKNYGNNSVDGSKKLKKVKEEPNPTKIFEAVLKGLDKGNEKSGTLTVVPPYNEKFATKIVMDSGNLQNLFKEEWANFTLDDLQKEALKLTFYMSTELCTHIEKNTQKQSFSGVWYVYRAGRITASKIHSVCKTKSFTSNPSLIKSICYPAETAFETAAVKWGKENENKAVESYLEKCRLKHKKLQSYVSGLVINPDYPYMGASPDRLIDCECCGKGVLEVKCPFLAKNNPTIQFKCLTYDDDGKLSLNRDSAYYYQVQYQMLICNVLYADFFIWQNQGEPFYERINFDKSFCDMISAKATEFFHKSLLPELMGRYFSSRGKIFFMKKNTKI